MPTAGAVVNPPPSEVHAVHCALPGELWAIVEIGPPLTRTKTCSALVDGLRTTTGIDVRSPPSDIHVPHVPLTAVCAMCQSALSVPRAKTSSRPSALTPTAGPEVITPPSDPAGTQVPSVRWPMIQRLPSSLR